MVIVQLALGSLRDRDDVLDLLGPLRTVVVATDAECLELTEVGVLYGRGLSYVDAHLLASARLTSEASIWTRDKRLRAASESVHVAWSPDGP